MSTAASKAFHTVLPPKATGKQKVLGADSSAVADCVPIFTGLSTDAPDGKVYVHFEAVTEDCYIRFLAADDASPDVDNETGVLIQADTHGRGFWLNAAVETHVEFVATGNGRLKWYVSSPEYDGTVS